MLQLGETIKIKNNEDNSLFQSLRSNFAVNSTLILLTSVLNFMTLSQPYKIMGSIITYDDPTFC